MISEKQVRFVEAVQVVSQTFNAPKHKKDLSDLSPRFWVALMDLELVCETENWQELVTVFKSAYKQLGAPGDFGYGTPCGDALRGLYDAWNALVAEKKAMVPV